MEFEIDKEIHKKIIEILKKIDRPYIKPEQIVCFKSKGSKSKARARIWSLPRIWQKALKVKPHYCIEVLSEKFDRLSNQEQIKILIHELMHIPKTFSGALLPHTGRGNVKINSRTVNELFKKYKENS